MLKRKQRWSIADLLTNPLTDWLADWFADWVTDWLTNWVTDWPVDWLIGSPHACFLPFFLFLSSTYLFDHTHQYMHTHIHTRTHTHTLIHTYIHTCIHTLECFYQKAHKGTLGFTWKSCSEDSGSCLPLLSTFSWDSRISPWSLSCCCCNWMLSSSKRTEYSWCTSQIFFSCSLVLSLWMVGDELRILWRSLCVDMSCRLCHFLLSQSHIVLHL